MMARQKPEFSALNAEIAVFGLFGQATCQEETISELPRREKPISTTWHADETYFKIKGKGHWLWIVYCAKTKQVLSWCISKKRLFYHARNLFKQALNIAGIRPKLIITDGLCQCAAAIKKVMGRHWRVYKKKHIVDSGIGKNALIERLNREIKRRIKWFSTFQSRKGAEAFFGLWFYHYNLNTTGVT